MPLTELPARWQGRRVLVVGDALLDGWVAGTPRQLCREAPVPVLAVDRTSYSCGGAANTASNLAALGARPTLVAVVGEDQDGARLRRRLLACGACPRLVPVRGRRTVAKRRLVADDQILLRYDEGDTGPLPHDAAAALRAAVAAELGAAVDAVMVCDYGGGILDDGVKAVLSARRADIPLLVVDAHQPGGWARLRPDLVTPSYTEAASLLGESAPEQGRVEWVNAARDRLLRASGSAVVAVTVDSDGAVVFSRDGAAHRTWAKPVPASRTAGAGDSYVSAFTLALVAGAPLGEAAGVAQLAATAATRTPGTAVCDVESLLAVAGGADRRVIAGAGALVTQVAEHRAQGRRIVFTNGCFDMLHRGHVGYLEQARRLGDILVVAVNSDESVRRLKGPDRPVNPEEDRVAVLAALSCVDHVVVFEEDSPAPLIALVRPDVYVKGGDYTPELIPEAELVQRLGGEVRTLDYLPDRSTTKIISRIRSGRDGSGHRGRTGLRRESSRPADGPRR